MSFWDNVKKFAQPYADDGDEYDEYDDEEGTEGYAEEPEEATRRFGRRTADTADAAPRQESSFNFDVSSAFSSTPSAAPVAAPSAAPVSSGFSGSVVSSGSKQQVVVFCPTKFDDSSRAANDLRSKKAVIVNMENVDKAMARRVVDFLSGCVFSLDGKVTKVSHATYLFTPYHMEVSGDILENLQSEVDGYI